MVETYALQCAERCHNCDEYEDFDEKSPHAFGHHKRLLLLASQYAKAFDNHYDGACRKRENLRERRKQQQNDKKVDESRQRLYVARRAKPLAVALVTI